MKKRPSLKGKGVSVFLGDERESPEPERMGANINKEKGTFYLPPSLLNALDNAWFILRKHNRRIRKSEIVELALTTMLNQLSENGEINEPFKSLTNKSL